MVKTKEFTADDYAIALITAALLRRGRMLNHISLILSALVLAQFSLQNLYKGGPIGTCPWMQAFVLLLGLAELWFAARVALDADLFEAIAGKKSDFAKLDDALMRLGLVKQGKAGRSMEDRSRGGFRLLKLQGMCLVGQTAVFLACILMS